jgi:hypothetical protein
MALSVATGTACLGKYAVPEPGPVLVYLAEDALPVVRERVEGMAKYRGLDLGQVEIHVITAPTLRLDRDRDRARLWETTKRLRPRLLVLDPLVRLQVATNAETTHLEVIAELQNGSTRLTADGKRRSLEEQVLDHLPEGVAVTRAKLRDSLAVKNERLGEALGSLERAGQLCRTPAGWQRPD